MKSSVLQDWVQELSWKKQTVLLCAIRSPDTLFTLNLKKVTVWQRSCILKNADALTGFMHPSLKELPLFEQVDREFERLPLHSAHHIQLAMQVIGFEHPNSEIQHAAYKFYCDSVRAEHLNTESYLEYEARMKDNVDRTTEEYS